MAICGDVPIAATVHAPSAPVGSVDGWPLMLSSLKSNLETGKPLVTQ